MMSGFETLEEMVGFLSEAPFFSGAPVKALESLVIDGDIVSFSAGDVLMREGDYEMICYVTLSGRFKISVTDKQTGRTRVVRIVGPGEILGEMSVLSGNPRLARVECLDAAVALKVHKNELLRFLDAAPEVKRRIDDDYKERALASALRRIDVFSLVDDLSMADLAKKVELCVYRKNQRIFQAGDEADAFYLIRYGYVRLSRRMAEEDKVFFDSRFDKEKSLSLATAGGDKEFIMAYLGPGSYFGERALLEKRERVSSATAVTRVELVKIGGDDFNEFIRRHPLVRDRLAAAAPSLEMKSREEKAKLKDQEMLTWAEEHDIFGSESILLLDLNQCVRCLHCIDVCAKLHDGVTRITHNGIRYKNVLIPTSCRHCREPTCMIGCPTGAIQRDIHGEVYHTSECIGCGNCASRCPFGNISIVETEPEGKRRAGGGWLLSGLLGERPAEDAHVRRRAVKCDLCLGYDHVGCQHNCPAGAIKSVNPSEYFSALAGV